MFELPTDLNPSLVGVAWLRGRWEGTGFRQWPGEEKVGFSCQIDFADNGGPFLHYLCQAFTVDDEQRPAAPLWMETGFWRPLEDGAIEVSTSNQDGCLELWYGKVEPARIDLTTDAVVRPPAQTDGYTAGRRLWGLVEGSLMWSYDRATTEHELQPWMWATMERA